MPALLLLLECRSHVFLEVRRHVFNKGPYLATCHRALRTEFLSHVGCQRTRGIVFEKNLLEGVGGIRESKLPVRICLPHRFLHLAVPKVVVRRKEQVVLWAILSISHFEITNVLGGLGEFRLVELAELEDAPPRPLRDLNGLGATKCLNDVLHHLVLRVLEETVDGVYHEGDEHLTAPEPEEALDQRKRNTRETKWIDERKRRG